MIVEIRLPAVLIYYLLITSAKRVNNPDVQNVLPSWFLNKNELKSTLYFMNQQTVSSKRTFVLVEQRH